MEATPAQHKLFGLIADFTSATVLGWVTCIYAKLGPKITAGDALVPLLTPFAERYFNLCARMIYSREDKYINEKFDEMTAIKLENTNHPIDILHIIVMMALRVLKSLDIKDVITPHPDCLKAVQAHIQAVTKRYSHLASSLTGCAPDHIHAPIQDGEKIFTFTIDQYVETEKGPVKLTQL